jgi:hypothetical protein
MEKQLAKLANKGLAGEPQYIVLQVKETLKCIEFSNIKKVCEGGVYIDVSLEDNNINQSEILHILNELGHEVEVTFDENDNVTLYF